jgi:hypothetical protein
MFHWLCIFIKNRRIIMQKQARFDLGFGGEGAIGYHWKFLSDAYKFTIVLAEAARVSNGECGMRASRDILTMTPVVWASSRNWAA